MKVLLGGQVHEVDIPKDEPLDGVDDKGVDMKWTARAA